jgi:hypothetical protein
MLRRDSERFLYVIGQHGSHAAPGNSLHVRPVDDEDGTLSELASSPVPLTLQTPDTRRKVSQCFDDHMIARALAKTNGRLLGPLVDATGPSIASSAYVSSRSK